MGAAAAASLEAHMAAGKAERESIGTTLPRLRDMLHDNPRCRCMQLTHPLTLRQASGRVPVLTLNSHGHPVLFTGMMPCGVGEVELLNPMNGQPGALQRAGGGFGMRTQS